MKRQKITVIGGGFVGATTAHVLALRELGDVVLLDINAGAAAGKALDLAQTAPLEGFDVDVKGTGDYADIDGSDVVVITAGFPRKPGMSRDDLLKANAEIVSGVSKEIKTRCPNAVVIVVTNPLDAMVYTVWKVTGFEPKRVIGMAGVLDTARMKCFLAEAANASVKDVHAIVLGGHGDTMVPMLRTATIGGVPVSELISKEKLDAIVERTRNGGAEIVSLLQTGSAYYAPATSVVEMVEAVVRDQNRLLPCAAYLDGEYGVKGLFIGVPAILGDGGVKRVVEMEFSDDEKQAFNKTVLHVEELIHSLPQQ